MASTRNVTILGAGLVGSLLAILLRKRGYPVTIYERRPDMRAASMAAGRSINLAMSTRGWHGLELAGLRTMLEEIALPMKGRYLHMPDGSTAFQPYGKNGEAIYSISRGELNKRLMSAAEAAGAEIKFEQRCDKVDVATNTVHFDSETRIANSELENAGNSGQTQSEIRNSKFAIQADLLFGADGAHSALRRAYMLLDRANASQHYIEHGYKELSIPPNSESRISNPELKENNPSTADSEFGIRNSRSKWQLEPGALHIWPRRSFMLIALPNTDGSFTCTLFAPFEGENSFASLTNEDSVEAFFKTHFADVLPLMPDYMQQFFTNPTSSLITTHISSWHYSNTSALIGDAAHAIVPFYGQGMNAGFEDCSVLSALMDKHGSDWATILQRYEQLRKPNGDAVAELALMNFIEMRDKVADPKFLERKKIEKELGLRYPEKFVSVYEMVSFSHTPYATAMQCIQAQDTLLQRIMQQGADFNEQIAQPGFAALLDEWMSEYHTTISRLEREQEQEVIDYGR